MIASAPPTTSVGLTQVGDVLILLGATGSPPAGRDPDATWRSLDQATDSRLLLQPSTEFWRGYPALHLADPRRPSWLIGELYGHPRTESCSLVREVVAGTRSAADLNGHFLLLARDTAAGDWHVWTNRFGTVHAYYATSGGRTAIGTFSPAVAAVASDRRLDWPALTAFCAFGFFPADRTHFEDVRILLPASHYVFGRDGALLHQERYWSWWHRPDQARSYADTVSEFASLLDEVLDDQTAAGRIAVPISGGLDSRTTVASLTRPDATARGRLWSYSYGYSPGSVETRIAGRIALARDLPFVGFLVRPYLFERLPQVVASLEGFQELTQARQASIVPEIAARADRVVAAHWGDVWLDDLGLAGARQGEDEALVTHALAKIRKPGHRWLLQHLCRPHLGGTDPEEVLRDFVRRGLAAVSDLEDPDFRVKAFKTEQWSFRWTLASLRMFQPGAFPVLPFYDTRLSDFFCTVPTEFVRGRRLQIDYLKRYAPDLARITWQEREVSLFRLGGWTPDVLLRRMLRKAWRAASGGRALQRNWEVQFLSPGRPAVLRRMLLRPDGRLHDLVDPGAAGDLLERFLSAPDRERGYAVSMLLTLSAWLERYA